MRTGYLLLCDHLMSHSPRLESLRLSIRGYPRKPKESTAKTGTTRKRYTLACA